MRKLEKILSRHYLEAGDVSKAAYSLDFGAETQADIDRVLELHRIASVDCESRGMLHQASCHSQCAGDMDRALKLLRQYHDSGQADIDEQRFNQLEEQLALESGDPQELRDLESAQVADSARKGVAEVLRDIRTTRQN